LTEPGVGTVDILPSIGYGASALLGLSLLVCGCVTLGEISDAK